jgi:hypothetical protein
MLDGKKNYSFEQLAYQPSTYTRIFGRSLNKTQSVNHFIFFITFGLNSSYFFLVGKSDSLKTSAEENDLKNLCQRLKLKFADSVCPISDASSATNSDALPIPCLGFKEIEKPQVCLNSISNFLHSPKR